MTTTTVKDFKIRMGPIGSWSPSMIAWALGTFSFALSAVFLVRIHFVYRYRQQAEIVSEEVHQVGVLVDRHISGIIKEVDEWVVKRPRQTAFHRFTSPPAVLGVRAVRVYGPTGLVAEWTRDTNENQQYGIEKILIRDANTRLVNLGGDLMGLSWIAKDQSKILLAFDKASFNLVFRVRPEVRSQVSMALVNSMEQVLLQSEKQLHFEVFRTDVQYRYDGRGTIYLKDLGADILAFLSLPSTKGLVLIGRTARQ